MDKNSHAVIEEQMLLAKRKVDFESAKKSNLNIEETLHKLIAVVQSLEAKIEDIIDVIDSIRVKNLAEGINHNESYGKALIYLQKGKTILCNKYGTIYRYYIKDTYLHCQSIVMRDNVITMKDFLEIHKDNNFQWTVE